MFYNLGARTIYVNFHPSRFDLTLNGQEASEKSENNVYIHVHSPKVKIFYTNIFFFQFGHLLQVVSYFKNAVLTVSPYKHVGDQI